VTVMPEWQVGNAIAGLGSKRLHRAGQVMINR
jgi:hypothetical protein